MTRLTLFMFAFSLIGLAACSSAKLTEGTWNGSLTPMNHPDMSAPIQYDVAYSGDQLELSIIGPDGQKIPTQNAAFAKGKVTFDFPEPEEGVMLHCSLSEEGVNSYAGRCTDDSGKWATFTMQKSE